MKSSRIRANIMTLAGVATLTTGLALVPALAHASVSPSYTCPAGYVCFYSVKISGKGGTLINLRDEGVAVPWKSVSNRDGGLVVEIYDAGCNCDGFALTSGQRQADPGAPYTSDGYMIVE
jgi:hypothetical protein